MKAWTTLRRSHRWKGNVKIDGMGLMIKRLLQSIDLKSCVTYQYTGGANGYWWVTNHEIQHLYSTFRVHTHYLGKLGCWALLVAAPPLWNSLRLAAYLAPLLAAFQCYLKTELFQQVFHLLLLAGCKFSFIYFITFYNFGSHFGASFGMGRLEKGGIETEQIKKQILTTTL